MVPPKPPKQSPQNCSFIPNIVSVWPFYSNVFMIYIILPPKNGQAYPDFHWDYKIKSRIIFFLNRRILYFESAYNTHIEESTKGSPYLSTCTNFYFFLGGGGGAKLGVESRRDLVTLSAVNSHILHTSFIN